jgi:hypothetical protein
MGCRNALLNYVFAECEIMHLYNFLRLSISLLLASLLGVWGHGNSSLSLPFFSAFYVRVHCLFSKVQEF